LRSRARSFFVTGEWAHGDEQMWFDRKFAKNGRVHLEYRNRSMADDD